MASKNINTQNIKYLNRDEFDELINAIKKWDTSTFVNRNLAIFLLAEYCGIRVTEVGLLKNSDLNLKAKTIFCRRIKGGVNNQLLILDNRVTEALSRYLEERKTSSMTKFRTSDYLFPSKSGKRIDRNTLDKLMKFYCSFTSISEDKWHFHVLRHTCAMRLVDTLELEIQDAQWWLGHKYISNTMIYLNYSISARMKMYNKISLKMGMMNSHI